MASVRERKNASGKSSWHAQVRIQGHEPQTRTFDRKTDAKSWADETERLIKAGRFRVVNEAQQRDFSELCQRFKAKYMRPSRAKDYTQILDWWESRLGRLRLINITSEVVQKCLAELMASESNARRKKHPEQATTHLPTPVHQIFGMNTAHLQARKVEPAAKVWIGESPAPRLTSAGTGLRYLAVLSRVFNAAMKQLGWIDRSPVAGVERPQPEEIKIPRTLDPAEEQRLLAIADASTNRALRIIIRIALRTGMRLNEIMRLRWNDIKFHENHAMVLVRKAKNKRQRITPLVGDAHSAVVSLRVPLRDAYSDALLFPSKRNATKPMSIRTAWTTCLKNAHVDEFRFHDLRHSLAARLAQENNSLPRIGNVLGHVDHRSTMIYVHFATDDALQMMTQSARTSANAIAKLETTALPTIPRNIK